MTKILVIGTGGTISGRGKDETDLKDYTSGAYTVDQLLANLPVLKKWGVTISTIQLTNFSSTNISAREWISLKTMLEEHLNEQGFDGAVITHGTNTIEETAYFLHLTLNSSKPVVLVGAQRPASALGTDAYINLLQAIRVAMSPDTHGKGVLVVLNDEINSAREVTKTNTYRLETFQSGQLGFLGYVDPDHTVQFYRSPTRKHTVHSEFAQLAFTELPRVPIVYSYAGADGSEIEAIMKHTQCRGLVIAGTGAGRFSSDEEKVLRQLDKEGIPVVRSSRVGNGRVVDIDCYADTGFISGDNLLPQKARILLMLALAAGKTKEEIRQLFTEY